MPTAQNWAQGEHVSQTVSQRRLWAPTDLPACRRAVGRIVPGEVLLDTPFKPQSTLCPAALRHCPCPNGAPSHPPGFCTQCARTKAKQQTVFPLLRAVTLGEASGWSSSEAVEAARTSKRSGEGICGPGSEKSSSSESSRGPQALSEGKRRSGIKVSTPQVS